MLIRPWRFSAVMFRQTLRTTLTESFVFYPVERFDIVGKQILKLNRKMYIVDLGLRNYILPRMNYDLGFSLENMVYFELLRRGYKVAVGKVGNTEVDFVAEKQGAYSYFQVSASTPVQTAAIIASPR